ncbi:lysophospholipid acyltransferase family protein [Amphritea sp.]|uniref:lysophospholipid acyltransferase family protein n=1 Tax=Amphritea sp. TaxID=1872502 RepID=UPI003D0EDDED
MGLNGLSFKQRSELLFARLLRLLPIDVASAIGGWLGRRSARKAIRLKRKWVARLHHNFERLEGLTDPQAREARIIEHIDHIGRVYAEYPVLHKIAAERLTVTGSEFLANVDGPIICVSAHTGHWELMAEVMRRHGIMGAVLYDPIPDKARLQQALKIRKYFCPEDTGNRHIPASPTAARELLGWLKSGRGLLLYIDEEKDGLVWSPALGRELPFQGNRVMAAKLAVKHNAPLIPIHIQRKTGANYEAIIESPIVPKANSDRASATADVAEQLNSTLERWLEEDYSHWYWLAQLNLDKPFSKREAN